ncbi:MAG: hypothetical protein JXA19_04440 [Anaerolineales bacterium]|nr:hypothetical protein [Anaerolineales bacterium]
MKNKLQSLSIPFPAVLLVFAVLAYGLFVGSVGFYWDDWVWVFHAHQLGSKVLLNIDSAFRPLAGIILWAGSILSGDIPIRWQILSLVFRMLSALSCWWAFSKIWPEKKLFSTAATLLIFLFPGFSQQFIAVNCSRHILPLSFFFLSLGFTGKAILEEGNKKSSYILSILLAYITMMTTEYFYGLELVRPLIIFLLYLRDEKKGALKKSLLHWLPFLVMIASIFFWRFSLTTKINYRVSIVSEVTQNPGGFLIQSLNEVWKGTFNALIVTWLNLFKFPMIKEFGTTKTVFFVGLSGLSFLVAVLALIVPSDLSRNRKYEFEYELILTGLWGCIISILPFWIVNIEPKFTFSSDRAFLAMGVGSAIFLVGLILSIFPKCWMQVVLISIFIGLSVGNQFRYAIQYRDEWRLYQSFFEQLSWRIPDIEPGTAIITEELPVQFSSDNSLTSPLNWMYLPGKEGETNLSLGLYYSSERLGTKIPDLIPHQDLDFDYRSFDFNSTTDQMILLTWSPPGCVRVLNPLYDQGYPYLSDTLQDNISLSNLDRIKGDPIDTGVFLDQMFPDSEDKTWCYYFQKADLARQYGNWDEIVLLANQAFEQEEYVKNALERIPYIQGYAYTGLFDKAYALTLESMQMKSYTESNKTQTFFCNTWQKIVKNTPPSNEKTRILDELENQMNNCTLE